MNILKTSTAMAAVAAMLAISSQASANTLYFQMNPNELTGPRQLFLFGPANATGTVTGPGVSLDFNLGAQGFAVLDMPLAAQLVANQIETKGFAVASGQSISGYFLSRAPATTDMTYLIDGERLGTNYVVAGYQNIRPDQMSVQATQDNTLVTFTPKGAPSFQVTLNAGQTYMYTASTQLTGSSILADKPIAVFSGNQCTNIPTGNSACDHIVEQMPSIDQLSSVYLLAQTPRTGTLGNVMRVVATEDNTEVRVNGTLVATLAAKGDYYEGRVAGGIELVATNPVLVVQYLIGQTQAGANTDPAMTIVPGSDQWLKSYVFATPSGSADFPTDYVSIIIQTASLPTLTLDGTVVDPALFTGLGSTLYSFGNIDVSSTTGPFAISAETPFQLLLSGFGSFDSYFTYGGAAFSPGASPPPEPVDPPPPGVDVYWDGDGAGNSGNGQVDGGDGVLTAGSPNLTLQDGTTNNILPSEPATVVFQGAPGTVTIDDVDGPVKMGGMRFLVDGYVITGDSVELFGTTPTIQVGTSSPGTAGHVATVASVLTGSAGLTKTGQGILVLSGANSYGGGSTVSGGVLIGNAATFGTGGISIGVEGTLVMNQAVDAEFGQSLTGLGNFHKTGAGTLRLTVNSSFSGQTTVFGGRLLSNGNMGLSAVTVESGGVLGGIGNVGATTVLSGGRIAAGDGLGALTINGDFAQNTGSFHDVEIHSNGTSDRLLITGAAAIGAGTTLNVSRADSGRPVLGTRYTVLTADDGRTGTYGAVTGATQVSAFIGLVAAYDANNVYLDVARTRAFATAGSTPNQIAAATGADNAGNGAMYQAIAYLPDDATARAAFDQVSGEIHASLRGIAMEDTRFVREAMINRTTSAREPGKGLWIHGYGSWGSYDGDGNAADVDRDIAGFFIGGEMVSSSGLIVGAVTGYGEAKIRVDDRNSRADTSDAYLGAYVGFDTMGFSARAGLAYMWRDVKTVRNIGFPGYADTTTAKYDLNNFQIFADAGYAMEFGGIGVEPFFQLAYVDVSDGEFRESGGSAALSGSGGEDFWLTQLGSRFSIGVGTGLKLTGSLGWRHTSGGDRNTPVSMRFGAGPAFDIAGVPVVKDAAAMSLAITGQVAKNLEIDAGYSGLAGSGVSDHGIRAALTFRF